MTDPVPSKDLVLQRCPFCGGAARWCADDEHECHQIVCDDCKISIDFNENPDVETVRELQVIMAQKWNMRAKPKPAHEREPPHCSTCECWKADTQSAPEPPAEWQPIETAPKKYTPILLKQDETIGEGWHASQLDIWEFANPQHVMRRRPTHWMPLPVRAAQPPRDECPDNNCGLPGCPACFPPRDGQ